MPKPDCPAGSLMHVLDWLDGGSFISSINEMLRPTGLFVPQSGKRMPRGWDSRGEARLGKQCGSLINDRLNRMLLDWWLAKPEGANVPNWDLACQARHYGNKPALVLAEAKAHVREFTDGRRGYNAQNCENAQRIRQAIEEARGGLSRHAQGVKISPDCWYQFSNRVAYAWKLASLGVPTALVYLGFLGDEGISTEFLRNDDHWWWTVRDSTREIFPSALWERPLDINGTPLWFLIRSLPCNRQSRRAALVSGGPRELAGGACVSE